MTTESVIKGLIPGTMAIGLLGENIAYLKRKKKKKSIIGLGVTNLAGIGLINATASAI